jgi:hyperosmotically inducible periplasmic protein
MRFAAPVRMTRSFTLLLCMTSALALACSKDKPAQSAYETERPVDEAPLTPASSDGYDHSKMHESSSSPAGTDDSGRATAVPDRSTAPDTIPPRDADSIDSGTRSSSPKPAADNTARNERDRDGTSVTPVDQGNNQSDLDITQKIRQAVMKNDSLSFTAKNVKIITKGGKVTLRGTVPTYEERLAIEEAARSAAGAGNVESEIEVKK